MDHINRIKKVCERVARISSSDQNITGPIGYLIGAAYSLIEATRYGYLYGQIKDDKYMIELRSISTALAEDTPLSAVKGTRCFDGVDEAMDLEGIWLAGFYFNSALHRIAAGAERIGVHIHKGDTPEPDVVRRARRDVNKLKHLMDDRPNQESRGILTGREVQSISSAIEALESLTDVCESKGIIG